MCDRFVDMESPVKTHGFGTPSNDFDLKLSVQHSENMSPLYLMIVSIYVFTSFYKASKWTRRIWGGVST